MFQGHYFDNCVRATALSIQAIDYVEENPQFLISESDYVFSRALLLPVLSARQTISVMSTGIRTEFVKTASVPLR